jgi:hypothetical protein
VLHYIPPFNIIFDVSFIKSHAINYMVAYPLIFGELTSES